MHFGENQLSPCSFGISPLPTAHPRFLQQAPVRPSTPYYGRCSLAMGGSHGFRSTPAPKRALFTLGFARAPAVAALTRPREVTRRVILQKARDHRSLHATALTAWSASVSGSVSLPSPGCFSPFPHGTVRYRSRPVGSLGPWSTQLPTHFSWSVVLELGQHGGTVSAYGTLTRSGTAFQPLRRRQSCHCARMHPPRCRLATPRPQRLHA